MEQKNKKLAEKAMFTFVATLKHVDKESTFTARFNVMAKDRYSAQDILEKWLCNPAQTGYKYEQCVGLAECPSSYIIVDEGMCTGRDLIDRADLLRHKRYTSLDRHEVECVVDVDRVLEAPSVNFDQKTVCNIFHDLTDCLHSIDGHNGLYVVSEADLALIRSKYELEGTQSYEG